MFIWGVVVGCSKVLGRTRRFPWKTRRISKQSHSMRSFQKVYKGKNRKLEQAE